jgi:hypothetical protein
MSVAIAMLAACTRGVQRAPSGAKDSVESITTGGVVRQYLLHIPPNSEQFYDSLHLVHRRWAAVYRPSSIVWPKLYST